MKLGAAILAVLLAATTSPAASAQGQGGTGPWDRDLWLAESNDGLHFGEPRRFVERGGVPSLVRDAGGRLIAAFQWFPLDQEAAFDTVAVAISSDQGKTWSKPTPITVTDLPPGYERPFDPTLVLLADGRIRIYFTTRDLEHQGSPLTGSAVSSDGITYRFEPGIRFEDPGQPVLDCAVVRMGTRFHYFAPVQARPGAGYHAVSDDGLTFERLADLKANGSDRWLGCAVDVGRDTLRFYGSGAGIWSTTSRDGARWQADEGRRSRTGADPGVARTADNRWLMVMCGELRADAGQVRVPRGKGGGPIGPTGGPSPGGAGNAAGEPPTGPALHSDGDSLWVVWNGELRRIDAENMKVQERGSLARSGGATGVPGGAAGTRGQDGPWRHRVLAADSVDGMQWTAGAAVVIEPASVPDAVIGDDTRVRLYIVDPSWSGISVGIGREDGTWSWRRTNLRGADPNVLRRENGGFRAYMKDGVNPSRITWADSEDGIVFEAPQLAYQDDAFPNLTDPDVFEAGDGWRMLVSVGPSLVLAESSDGRQFRTAGRIELGGSVCDTVAVAGGWRTFFHKNPTRDTPMSIWSAFTSDGRSWQVEGVRLRARPDGADRLGVGDPAVVMLPDGRWRMYYKSFIPE